MTAEEDGRPAVSPGLRFLPCGVGGLLVETAGQEAALGLASALADACPGASGHGGRRTEKKTRTPFDAVTDIIPAARTVGVLFDPLLTGRSALAGAIRGLDASSSAAVRTRRTVDVPVSYTGEDLDEVAALLGVSPDQVAARHAGSPWTAAFAGFAPGFVYLTGGDPVFDVPRRRTPRLAVPAGAVGLAGRFSGVYPRPSSGGWQIIGATDMPMWDASADSPAAVRPGDAVRFVPVRPTAKVSGSPGSRGTADGSPDRAFPHDAAGPLLRVVDPGVLATIQDNGRRASAMGVSGSGAADPVSFRLANGLVGNLPDTPAIELTGGNAELAARGDMVVAVAGAPVPIAIRGRSGRIHRVTRQEAFLLRSGEGLRIGEPDSGLRDYLAVRGGLLVPRTLGSASTDTMGGVGPRPLRPGDELAVRPAVGRPERDAVASPLPWPDDLPRAGRDTVLRVVPGPRDDWFTDAGLRAFLGRRWRVTVRSNRVGLRLHGDVPVGRRDDRELASEATVPGAVEVPSDGQPVVFLRDQPVTGGYPVVAVLTPEALALAGQLPPGAFVRFSVAGGRIGTERIHEQGREPSCPPAF